MKETIVDEVHPSMWRNNPFKFLLCILLIPVFGLGLILLLPWYLNTKAQLFTITSQRVIYKQGIISKNTNDISISNIRNIQTKQSAFQRIMGVGSIKIASAGTGEAEIKVNGLKNPLELKDAIRKQGEMQAHVSGNA